LLLERGANVDDLDTGKWSALMHASFHGMTNVVRILLDAGAKIKPEGAKIDASMVAATRC